ncbi:MAG: hypothetical protein ACYTEW_20895, partial [Planctomycetota bacterium]
MKPHLFFLHGAWRVGLEENPDITRPDIASADIWVQVANVADHGIASHVQMVYGFESRQHVRDWARGIAGVPVG